MMTWFLKTRSRVLLIAVIALCTLVGLHLANIAFANPSEPNTNTIAIIGNKVSTPNSLSIAELVNIYTLNTQRWGDNQKIVFFDLKGTHKIKDDFYKVLEVSPDDVRRIWLRKQFSGKATPPQALSSEEEIVSKVASIPGAIGYVRSDKVTKEVRILTEIKM